MLTTDEIRSYHETHPGKQLVLRDADLRDASLRDANLRGADLRGADLRGADLRVADLRGANLRGADLRGAYLRGADLRDAGLPHFQLPDGDLIVWGKKSGVLVKMRIPANARRTACLINRKCRAEWADVITVENKEKKIKVSNEHGLIIYREGERVTPHEYNDDPRIDCAGGIHFFLTKEEAKEW